MASHDQNQVNTLIYQGTDQLLVGIILAVIIFWLFAQTALNIAPAISADLKISHALNDLAIMEISQIKPSIKYDVGIVHQLFSSCF